MELNLDWRRMPSALWPEVSYELRPLRVWAFQELLSFWEAQPGAAQAAPGTGAGARTLAATAALMDVARRILPEHVRALEGLHLRGEAGGGPALPEALCEETLLMPLAAEMVTRLIEMSALDGAAEKN